MALLSPVKSHQQPEMIHSANEFRISTITQFRPVFGKSCSIHSFNSALGRYKQPSLRYNSPLDHAAHKLVRFAQCLSSRTGLGSQLELNFSSIHELHVWGGGCCACEMCVVGNYVRVCVCACEEPSHRVPHVSTGPVGRFLSRHGCFSPWPHACQTPRFSRGQASSESHG